jgi:hypothetical protein
MNKSGWIAFFLSVIIPGAGHLYLFKYIRAVAYFILFFAPPALGLLLGVMVHDDDFLIFGVVFAAMVWIFNKFDIVLTIAMHKQNHASGPAEGAATPAEEDLRQKNEKTAVMLWSFLLPGLGHLFLGLMMRGLTFLVSFFGVMVMVVFVAAVTGQGGFAVFLGALPVIWLFSLFDALHLVSRKHQGEELTDRSVFEDIDEFRATGRKSKLIATLLSIFPGAGHMYLGLQKRGLQLMAGFLFSLYILDVLRFSLFLFLIPILWFYSFFDALQHISRYSEGELKDVPVIDWLINHQKWLGIGLVLLGGYYLCEQILLPAAARLLEDHVDLYALYSRYFQTAVISVLLIGGGLKLLSGSRQRRKKP